MEKITSTDLNTNINLFKYIRHKIIDILGSANQDIDLIKIEILKLLIISTKYQHSFIRDFIHGDDDIQHNDILFTNLNNSLKLNHNYDDNIINNNENKNQIDNMNNIYIKDKSKDKERKRIVVKHII